MEQQMIDAIRHELLRARAQEMWDEMSCIRVNGPVMAARDDLSLANVLWIGNSGPWADQSGFSDESLESDGIVVLEEDWEIVDNLYDEVSKLSAEQAQLQLDLPAGVTFTPAP